VFRSQKIKRELTAVSYDIKKGERVSGRNTHQRELFPRFECDAVLNEIRKNSLKSRILNKNNYKLFYICYFI